MSAYDASYDERAVRLASRLQEACLFATLSLSPRPWAATGWSLCTVDQARQKNWPPSCRVWYCGW